MRKRKDREEGRGAEEKVKEKKNKEMKVSLLTHRLTINTEVMTWLGFILVFIPFPYRNHCFQLQSQTGGPGL